MIQHLIDLYPSIWNPIEKRIEIAAFHIDENLVIQPQEKRFEFFGRSYSLVVRQYSMDAPFCMTDEMIKLNEYPIGETNSDEWIHMLSSHFNNLEHIICHSLLVLESMISRRPTSNFELHSK